MKIRIIIGLLVIIGVLIFGCKTSICGNGIAEEGETSENCCKDVGCPEGFSCEENVCIEKLVGAPNPSARYCIKLGYKFDINSEQIGICTFPDGSECDSWYFYAGLCGQKWSYCEQYSYSLEVRSDGKDSDSPYAYSVCIDKISGKEIGMIRNLINFTSSELLPNRTSIIIK